jgi:predicted O-methyltransferase YrrM
LKDLKGKPNLRALEIGCFEGRSTVWFLENILTDPTSEIWVVDPFKDNLESTLETKVEKPKSYLNRFWGNTAKYRNKIREHEGLSQLILRDWIGVEGEDARDYFDFIYIDGSHKASDVLEDLVLCHRLLKKGGIIICDDYQWTFFVEDWKKPRMAIDSFFSCFIDQYDLVWKGYQIAYKKL